MHHEGIDRRSVNLRLRASLKEIRFMAMARRSKSDVEIKKSSVQTPNMTCSLALLKTRSFATALASTVPVFPLWKIYEIVATRLYL